MIPEIPISGSSDVMSLVITVAVWIVVATVLFKLISETVSALGRFAIAAAAALLVLYFVKTYTNVPLYFF